MRVNVHGSRSIYATTPNNANHFNQKNVCTSIFSETRVSLLATYTRKLLTARPRC
ncbi:MAG: hypothetical protein VB140_09785 [Burkholderia sp.]